VPRQKILDMSVDWLQVLDPEGNVDESLEPALDNETLEKFYMIAKKHLNHVYIGNTGLRVGSDTFCSNCGKTVIQRNGYFTYISGLDIKGNCISCGTHLNIKNE